MSEEEREPKPRKERRRHRDRDGGGGGRRERSDKKRRHKDKTRDKSDIRSGENNSGSGSGQQQLPESANGGGSANNQEFSQSVATGLSTLHDEELSHLQKLCDTATSENLASWEKIRKWLRNHSAVDAKAAAERRGDYETTPLHLACRNCPPSDIVQMLLTASPRTVELADSFGWLPLHYACANEASENVLMMLAEEYPESKTSVDKRKRTPLHFALGHTERPATVETVVLLSGTGAALMADENGMLPLHYACAYGATEPSLRVLTDDHILTITATDNRGRTPLHFALGNADRPASPGVVGLLLSQNPAVANAIDLEGNLPIHLLATRAQAIKDDEKEKCTNCQECFSLYLNAHPRASADLLTALQSLPEWLRDYAVLSPVVQKILNVKIAQRFPTAVTLMDFVFYVLVIAFFQLAVISRLEATDNPNDMNKGFLAPLYIAAFYFSVREMIQALSLASLGLFNTYVSDPSNGLDLIYILLVLFWTIVMNTGGLNQQVFQTGAALSIAIFWVMILSFLQSIFVGFAVFVGGVIYVMKRLVAFLLALAIILIAFSQMFYTLFRQTEFCQYGENADSYTVFPVKSMDCGTNDATNELECTTDLDCEPVNEDPYCNFRTSFFRVFTMLLGEVDEAYFRDNTLATFLYALFMFACVIVLANVLIAIVTDSYGVIQNERAALVFWSNRLDFVAEMDVISSNFARKGERGSGSEESATGELWKKFMYLFDDEIDEHGIMSIESIVYIVLRVFAACVILPLWIIFGLITFGMLWPPQVREKLLTSQTASLVEKDSAERTRLDQVSRLKEDVNSFQEEVRVDMEKGRDEIYIVKAVLDSTKTEIHDEMNNVKEIVTELFELLSG